MVSAVCSSRAVGTWNILGLVLPWVSMLPAPRARLKDIPIVCAECHFVLEASPIRELISELMYPGSNILSGL